MSQMWGCKRLDGWEAIQVFIKNKTLILGPALDLNPTKASKELTRVRFNLTQMYWVRQVKGSTSVFLCITSSNEFLLKICNCTSKYVFIQNERVGSINFWIFRVKNGLKVLVLQILRPEKTRLCKKIRYGGYSFKDIWYLFI